MNVQHRAKILLAKRLSFLARSSNSRRHSVCELIDQPFRRLAGERVVKSDRGTSAPDCDVRNGQHLRIFNAEIRQGTRDLQDLVPDLLQGLQAHRGPCSKIYAAIIILCSSFRSLIYPALVAAQHASLNWRCAGSNGAEVGGRGCS